jgi:hypothetical protein
MSILYFSNLFQQILFETFCLLPRFDYFINKNEYTWSLMIQGVPEKCSLIVEQRS